MHILNASIYTFQGKFRWTHILELTQQSSQLILQSFIGNVQQVLSSAIRQIKVGEFGFK